VQELERERHLMNLANRYLKAGRPERLGELGLTQGEIRNLIKAGGYSSAALTRMRDLLRYYRKKSRRKLWLPDKGDAA
jgi:hypothetical protein